MSSLLSSKCDVRRTIKRLECSVARIIAIWMAAILVTTAQAVMAQPQPSILPAGQLEMPRLIDLVAERLDLNIEYDASTLKGTATLRLEAGVSDDELWQLTNRLLAARGFTTVFAPNDAVYSVVRLTDAPGLVDLTAQPVDPPPGFSATLHTVQNRPAREIAEIMATLVAKQTGTTTAINDTTLLIADLTAQLDAARELIRLLDVAGERTVVEELTLDSLTGAQMATLVGQVKAKQALTDQETIGEILPGLDIMSVLIVAPANEIGAFQALIQDLDRRVQLDTVTYAALHYPADEVAALISQTMDFSVHERWRIIVDDLTDSLVITATPAAHDLISALIARLDAAPTIARRPVRTYVIKNRSVLEVQQILERLVDAGVIDPMAESTQTSDVPRSDVFPMPPPLQGEDVIEPESSTPRVQPVAAGRSLVLTSDEGTNTLIAIGPPRLLSQIETLLETIDVRQPQVMLEVLMVTLTDGQTLSLGVELEKMTQYNDAQIRLSSLFGLSMSSNGGSTTPDAGPGFTGSVLSPGDFSILIRALKTINDGHSLSMPQLLVGNNQSATFDSVLQQPFASVNASNTVSTTSFGGTQDAGTIVTITPQIAEGDHLMLEYSLSLSSFQGTSASAALPPPRQQNSVSSVATIPDGFTVVVGGIELEDRSEGISQVPLLGRIPVIGEAFKSRQRSSTHTRFYVFIRANILRDKGFDDLKYISEQHTTALDIDDDWPTVSPRIIE